MKGTQWIIIRIGATGKKVPGGYLFNNYETACSMQKTLEIQNPYSAFLIYTADEWVYECENGRA